MNLKSNFKADFENEKRLMKLVNTYYKSKLKNYSFERITNTKQQHQGIDLIFSHNKSSFKYFIDEKAQLDYINEDLPTFAFELSYLKGGNEKKGWLFDEKKKTDFYSLITAIYSDEENFFTSCKITFVSRKKLIAFLQKKGISNITVSETISKMTNKHGKHKINGLDDRKEGYLFFSKLNKNEQPINLVLRLEFLIKNKLAKRLI